MSHLHNYHLGSFLITHLPDPTPNPRDEAQEPEFVLNSFCKLVLDNTISLPFHFYQNIPSLGWGSCPSYLVVRTHTFKGQVEWYLTREELRMADAKPLCPRERGLRGRFPSRGTARAPLSPKLPSPYTLASHVPIALPVPQRICQRSPDPDTLLTSLQETWFPVGDIPY